MYNNYSSSEDLTESQNFEKFMNAKDSDDEEKALHGKKKGQTTGFAGAAGKASNTKTYPTYGAPSYTSSYNQGGGGGYGTTSGYGASAGGGYGTGYGTYGGGGTTSGYGTGYGGGYGSGTGFGASASGYGGSGYGGGGSGFGASGYGGSGYGASGYGGGGYGDSNPYAGVDITGYGGGGYTGGGAGTGYKDKDDEDEYDDEDEEEEEPVEFDLASVKKRKEEQKAKKEAEEKKAEEERKAKEERQAYLASLATKTSSSTTKKEKNAKVTFNLGEAIQDDSDNDNNKNISHISERDDSNASSDRQATKKKPTTTSNNRNFLNISDDEKKVTEDSDEKIVPESEDNIEDVEETPKKPAYDSKKEEKGSEIESSYADDFEASSSKFGSADMGKAALKLNTKKTNEFEDSSHLSESKDARYDDKYTDRIVDTKAETKPAILTDAKTTTYQTKPSEQTQNLGPSSLTQHYETRIAKDYVYESLLKDEKMKIDRLEAQLSLGGDQVRNVQQLIAEKDVTIHKLMTETQKLQKDMDIWQFEAQDYEKKNKIYEIENEDLQKRIEVLESKLKESESQKRILSKDNEDKTKALKERKTALEEEFKESIIRELKAQQENEKDLLFLKIEDLEDKNKRFEEQNEALRENSRLYKTNFREKAESDQEVRRLKQEIMVLELKLKDRDQNKSKKPAAAETSTAPTREALAPVASGVPELDKEIQMQELLIKGFQKENEKLIVENKALKKEIEDLNGRLYDEGKKVTEIKAKLVHNTDNVLITDKEIDIETKKMLGAENLISKDELKVARERIVQLQKDLQGREEVFNQREIEMKFELDRLRAQKMNLEARSGGVDLNNLKQQDESYKQLQGTLENEKQRYEAELRDLRSKLKWYIENQESIAAKEDIIKQKNEAIQKLEEDISKILSDPSTNLDAKSKHFNKVSNEDKKRIKQLERDVETLEENLKKRNPGVYDKMKAEKDESALVKDLKQTVKRLQDDKVLAEKEYDTKLNDLRQKFDKMKLGYENREPVQVNAAQSKNAAANLENVEVLKTRIKELEKEVEDAKKYYLKKAQQLKDNKKGTKSTTLTVEKDLRATKETAKGSTKKVQFNVDSEVSSDKENQDSSNTIYDAERINLLNKLVNLPTTPVYALLNGFETYRTGALTAFKNNNTTQASNIKKEFAKLVSETLGDYPQRDQISQKIKRVDELIVTEHNDPRYTLDQIQYAIYDLVWSEMKKDRSNMTISSSKAPRVNNFFGSGAEDNGDVSGRKLIVLEEALKKKEEELNNAQQKLSVLNSDNSRLHKDKSNLELIIQQLPKNPKSLDFATMEKKLEILERNYRENELEMKNAFRKAYGRDPFGSVSEDEINKIKANYENEIAHLRSTIERKNQEISTFRQQMEVILKELDRLRKNRA